MALMDGLEMRKWAALNCESEESEKNQNEQSPGVKELSFHFNSTDLTLSRVKSGRS